MSKQLNVSETPVTEMNVNIIGDEQQYIDHLQSVQPTDVTFLIENSLQYVQPVRNEIIINKFPDQNAFNSQASNLTWSDLSVIYEDNDFADKSNMFVYFYDYDGSVAYKYNIDEIFVLDKLPPLPDHSDINKICDGWNWTLQEIKDYLEEYPADIHVGCTVHCGSSPELGSSHVRFYDHEGEVLYDYTAAQFLSLSVLPALPDLSSINRVADGWNWTLSQITTYLKEVDGDVNVGYTMSPGNNPSNGSSVVRFIDYEGTVLYTYTAAQFLALSDLPALPDRTSENLTCDGWNWTLSEITTYLNNVDGDVNVGAIYHTTDDKTHITFKPTETFPQAYINLTPTVANAVTVDWGDGSTDTWTSTSATTKSHTYTGVTDSSVYDITISCSSGTYSFKSNITGTSNNKNCVYINIKLSNKITSLATGCFQNCSFLQSINIPNSVTSLGSSCFYCCYSLQSINIPNGVTSLVGTCFGSCYSLQSITIPSGVTSLGNNCFNNCYFLQSITIPSGVTSLGDSCFYGCYSLKSINIPNGVTSLGDSCVRRCYSLQSINIPNSVTSFGIYCFYGCYSLQSITIPSGVTSLGDSCFYGCYSLKSINIPNSVTSLGSSCFYGCYSLQSITTPSGVTSLSDYCFEFCSSLQSITIPNSVTSFGNNCFYGCSSLQSITIPNGVTSLGDSCFYVCYSLQSITIPSGVTSLNYSCFFGCYSLKSIAISKNITSFGNNCFYNCFSLRSLTIPDSVTSLGTTCFQSCRVLQFITIPDSVTSLGDNCFNNFFGYFTYTLRFMYMKPTTPPTLANTSAIGNSTEIIYVPTGTGDAYKGATNWSSYSSKIVEYNNFKKSNSLTPNSEEKDIIFNKTQTYNNTKEGICILDNCYDVKSTVNFYDYDGVILYSFSKNEFLNLTNLPELPDRTSENLTCDGWNWTLSEITSYLNTVDGDVNVGAIYHTTDNKTHITCKPTNTFTGTSICLKPTVADAVTVDWGDGTTDTWTSTSQATKSHTYTNVTSASVYDITISCSSGAYSFPTYISGTQANNKICAYTDIKLSNKVTTLGSNCFDCSSLQSITIPSSVTSFGGYCFKQCVSLQHITIPRGITFNAYIFYQCSSLQSISIPNSIGNLNNACFYGCSSLQSITIPSGVTGLYSDCFNNCSSLQSITIPSGVTNLDSRCFSGCVSLQSITIPNSVTSLGGDCFLHCNSLKSIDIPNSVTSLGSQCFYQCTSLQYVTMSSNATNLGSGCFRDCKSLQSITIPNGVTGLGSQFFYGCSSLQSIVMPNTVTSLGDSCFYDCYSLKSITMPSGITSLGDSCFHCCYSLQSINIPNGVTSLGSSCFYCCYSLQSINIPNGVTSLGSTCFYGCYSLKSITMSSSITSLGDNCFYNCFSLQSISIPSGVTSLENSCFYNCSSLQSIVMPNTVTSLGNNCFSGCTSLQSITIPSGVTSLGGNCFYNCNSLQNVTIPSGVTSLGSSCFSNCGSLYKIYMERTTPPTLANTNAIPNNTNLVIYVPSGSLTAYQSASNWSTFASNMKEL